MAEPRYESKPDPRAHSPAIPVAAPQAAALTLDEFWRRLEAAPAR